MAKSKEVAESDPSERLEFEAERQRRTMDDPLEQEGEMPPVMSGTSPQTQGQRKGFLHTKKGKIAVAVTAMVAVIVVLLAFPTTRYAFFGLFVKKSVVVYVTDTTTGKAVSEASVQLGLVSAKTGPDGMASLEGVAVGNYDLMISKKYYMDTEVPYTVPILSEPQKLDQAIKATGRQVMVKVTNKITKEPVAKATVQALETSAVTDDKGIAAIVLPADQKTVKGMVSLDGYSQAAVEIAVTEEADANSLAITPNGNLFYLSKQTGKINVMKSNLDGTSEKTVVKGTGNESDDSTVLLADRDWKYLALSARRNNDDSGQLYVVDTATGRLKTIDKGDARFQLIGWSNHRFMYVINRNNKKTWEDGQQAIKMYNADTGELSTLDETAGSGSNPNNALYEFIQDPYLLEDELVYGKVWYGNPGASRQSTITSIDLGTSEKKQVKAFSSKGYVSIDARLYAPQEIYFRVQIGSGQATFYEYEDGELKTETSTDEKFYNGFYATYLISPSGQKTLWYEPRNGKNTILIGDKDGKKGKVIANLSEYTAYGWYSDDFVLLSKNDSELYIAPANKVLSGDFQPIKVTDYHKPRNGYPGYGYGYGGV